MSQWYSLLVDAFGIEVGILGGGYREIRDLTVCIYDSAYVFAAELGSRFDLIVFDEVHHLPSPKFRQIPDFKFTHRDGRVAHLEIVGFCTPEYTERKLQRLRKANLPNMIVAVPNSLDSGDLDFQGPIIRHKQRLLIKDVLPVLESVAVRES